MAATPLPTLSSDRYTAPTCAAKIATYAYAGYLSLWFLTGCSTPALQNPAQTIAPYTQAHLGTRLIWQQDTASQQTVAQAVQDILAQPIEADQAVRLALLQSPALQALIAETVAAAAQTTQSSQLPNPMVGLAHLTRHTDTFRELSIERVITLSLLDLLTWPQRQRTAAYAHEQQRLALTQAVLHTATQARQAWVAAVSAQEQLDYAQSIQPAAQAAAELAQRMAQAGNFSTLQRDQEILFTESAQTILSEAQQAATSTRENLIRILGLTPALAEQLRLPEHLPELPKTAPDPIQTPQQVIEQRLDIQLARSQLAQRATEQGLKNLHSVLQQLNVAWYQKNETQHAPQKGWAIDLSLPILDWGDAQRTEARAQVLAAAQQAAQTELTARSQIREAYQRWQTTYQIATQYQARILPRRQAIAEQLLQRYNGMLVSVFDLIADARERVNSVQATLTARRNFWLADAALHATLLGTAPIDEANRLSAGP